MLKICISSGILKVTKVNNTFVFNAEFKEDDHPRDKDGKFTKGAGGEKSRESVDKKEERPISGNKLNKMINEAYGDEKKLKELADFAEKYGHLYKGTNVGGELKEIYESQTGKDFNEIGKKEEEIEKYREEIKIKENKRKEIKKYQEKIDNLHLPKKISKETLKKIFTGLGFRTSDYLANTGSYYLNVDLSGTKYAEDPSINKRLGDGETLRISLRDHYMHSRDYVEPDFDVFTDKDYNYIDTIEEISELFGIKGSLITKIKKMREYENKIRDLKEGENAI